MEMANWQGWHNKIDQMDYQLEDFKPDRCPEKASVDEEVDISNLIEFIRNALEKGSIKTALFYFKVQTKYSLKISTKIRQIFCEESNIFQNPLFKDEGFEEAKEETQSSVGQKIKIIFGTQALFFELGRLCEKSSNCVFYSDDRCFFDRNFFQSLAKNSDKTFIFQKKVSCLLDDIKKFESTALLNGKEDLDKLSFNQESLKNIHLISCLKPQKLACESISPLKHKRVTFSISNASTDAYESTQPSTASSHSQNTSEKYNSASKLNSSGITLSNCSTEISEEMAKLNQDFTKSVSFKASVIDLLAKLPGYFNKSADNWSLKFINALENLVIQHLNKTEKGKKDKMTEKDKENYLLFFRNYLIQQKIVSGVLLEMWAKTKFGDSREKMIQSHSVKFDFEQLDLVIKNLKSSKGKFTLKNHELKGNLSLYGCICYSVIKKMLENDLNRSEKPVTSCRKLCDNIHHTIKNFYNSKCISQEQKELIKADNKIRYIISEIFRCRGIWKMEDKTFSVNTTIIQGQLLEFTQYEKLRIVKDLMNDISKIVAKP
ncbi:unnamed protein product [Moneuplotes crassus]|uniref:Uncharacterized protein n=1 Tax=Euplotes crassus TaxID=5936 RepID=A0AAD2DA31_EUPCR|nr:unnamed protein product [Moneuplotes crassus]